MTRRGLTRGAGALIIAALLVLSVVAAGAASNNAANWSSSSAPDVEIVEDSVTIKSHDRAEMSSLLDYENDDGNVDTLPARLNDSVNNSVGVHYARIDDDSFTQFPRKSDETNNSASWADETEWTTTGTNATKISVTDADGSTAANVDALKFATDGTMGTGDDAAAEYTNLSITSDAEKRVARLVFNVDTLDAGAELTVEFVDADGDTKVIAVNASADASRTDVAANTTGTSFVYQTRLADLATDGTGDGSFDAIETVRVQVVDADATVTVTYMDGDPKSAISMGEKLEDTDSDSALETTTIEQKTSSGEQRLESLAGMGTWADDAIVNDLEVYGLIYEPQHLASEDVIVEFDPGFQEDYNYPHGSATYLRFTVPAQIDVVHHGLELRLGEQAYVSDRYVNLDVAEGTGSTDLKDVESWSDKTGSLVSKGDTASLDTTVPTGENVDVRVKLLQKDSEFANYKPDTGGSDGGAKGGGLSSLPLIGGVIAVLLAWLGRIRGD